jgi:hypothetical protein
MVSLRRFNYQHLLYFWAVVRTGSLRRACEELSLSAPTISAQLRTLEHRLGEKLLEKSGRTLVPTEIASWYSGTRTKSSASVASCWMRWKTGRAGDRCAWSSASTTWYPRRRLIG